MPLQPTEYRYEPMEKCWWFCLLPTVLCVSQVVSLPTPQASERSVPLGHLVFQRTSRAQVLEICSLYPRGFWKLNFPQSPTPSSGRNCSLYLTNADCSSTVCWEPRCLSNVVPKSRSIKAPTAGLGGGCYSSAGENGFSGLLPSLGAVLTG